MQIWLSSALNTFTSSLSPVGWDAVPLICIYSPWPALKTSTALPWALGPMNSFSFLFLKNILFVHICPSLWTSSFALPIYQDYKPSPIPTSPQPERSSETTPSHQASACFLTVCCLVDTQFHCFTPSTILYFTTMPPLILCWLSGESRDGFLGFGISHMGAQNSVCAVVMQHPLLCTLPQALLALPNLYHYQHCSHFIDRKADALRRTTDALKQLVRGHTTSQVQSRNKVPLAHKPQPLTCSAKLLDLGFHICLVTYWWEFSAGRGSPMSEIEIRSFNAP